MKNNIVSLIASLGVLLVLASCASTDDRAPRAETGYLVFDFRPAVHSAQTEGLPEPTGIRIVVLHENGFQQFLDVAIPATEPEVLPLPAMSGYEVAAFSYVDDPGTQSARIILKDAIEHDVVVVSGQNTRVELTLEPVQLTIAAPEYVASGDSYQVTVSRTTNIPHDELQLYLSLTPIPGFDDQPATTDQVSLNGNGTTFLTATSTEDFAGETVYNTVLSAIGPRYVNAATGEHTNLFHIISPSAVVEEDPVTTTILEDTGGIEIIVTYGL